MSQKILKLSTYACGGEGMLSIDNAHEKPIQASEWSVIKPTFHKHDDLDDMDNFDMPSAWYIGLKNCEYLKSKGYTIIINGIEWVKPTWEEEKQFRKENQKIASEKAKKESEERYQKEKAEKEEFERNSKEMIGDMISPNIQIYHNEVEVIPNTRIEIRHKIGGMCADRVDYCQKIKIPKLNCEGVMQYWDIYDMETTIFYIPKELAEKINHEAFMKEVENPSASLVIDVIKGENKETKEIQDKILQNYKNKALNPIPISEELKQKIQSEVEYNWYKLKGLGYEEKIIADHFQITEQVIQNQAIFNQQLSQILNDNQRIQKEKAKAEAEVHDLKWKAYKNQQAKLSLELQELTKNQLIAKYSTIKIMPSWGKQKIIEKIVNNMIKFSY